jgi:hypothetical protein
LVPLPVVSNRHARAAGKALIKFRLGLADGAQRTLRAIEIDF